MKQATLPGAISLIVCLALAAQPLRAADITHCKSIIDNNVRLACYDQAAGLAGGSVAEPVVTADPVSTTAVATVTQQTQSPLARRLAKEEAMMNNPFVIIPHGRNYILPVTYNSKSNEDVWTSIFPDAKMDDVEAKFQISFKVRLLEDLIGNGDLWAAYTQQNWWQVYNKDESAPFRETNYEPEIMMVWDNDWEVAGFTNSKLGIGLNHQSNGRGTLLSRSWNRIMASAVFEGDNTVTRLRLWHRIEESESDDDNPNMDKYYGYGDLLLAYHWRRQEFSALLRNNLRFDNGSKGAVQLEWTLPVNDRFKWYLQYFYGYGESLIDYNVKTSRVGLGFTMNNFF